MAEAQLRSSVLDEDARHVGRCVRLPALDHNGRYGNQAERGLSSGKMGREYRRQPLS